MLSAVGGVSAEHVHAQRLPAERPALRRPRHLLRVSTRERGRAKAAEGFSLGTGFARMFVFQLSCVIRLSRAFLVPCVYFEGLSGFERGSQQSMPSCGPLCTHPQRVAPPAFYTPTRMLLITNYIRRARASDVTFKYPAVCVFSFICAGFSCHTDQLRDLRHSDHRGEGLPRRQRLRVARHGAVHRLCGHLRAHLRHPPAELREAGGS